MRSGWLDRWLWRGTFEVEASAMEVFEEKTGGDLVERMSAHLEEVARQIDGFEEKLRRERLVARSAGAVDHGGGPREVGASGGDNGAEMKRFARSMLPAMDALDRLIEFGESMDNRGEVIDNWLKAIEALRSRLTKTMESIGLSPISSVGMEVDLNVHDVVAVVPAGEFPPNSVVKEQQKGYYFRGKLLRDARVVVAQ